MNQAFVRTDEGWRSGYVQDGILVVGEGVAVKTEAEARKQLLLAGERAEKLIVSDQDYQPYDVMLRVGESKPHQIRFGTLEFSKPRRRRWRLPWPFRKRNH